MSLLGDAKFSTQKEPMQVLRGTVTTVTAHALRAMRASRMLVKEKIQKSIWLQKEIYTEEREVGTEYG